MKHLLLFSVLGVCMLVANHSFTPGAKSLSLIPDLSYNNNNNEGMNIGSQDKSGYGRMSAVVFKNQDYCRAELENFEFDAHFDVISATVYFSGGNLKGMEKGMINSNSLKPIKSIMQRCSPGTIVIFDDVKVKGPDKIIRTIPGMSVILF